MNKLLLALFLSMLVACGGGSKDSPVEPPADTEAPTPAQPEPEPEPEPVDPVIPDPVVPDPVVPDPVVPDPVVPDPVVPDPVVPDPVIPDPVIPDPVIPDPVVPPPPPPPVGSVTYDQLLGDMSVKHESTVHGVNPAWGWGTRPRVGLGVNFPALYEDPHFVPWGIAATATSGSSARNTRVQLRKLILDVKRNGTWSRVVYNSNDNQIMGSLYTNYETNATAPANVRKHGSDGISVKLPDSGGSFHFMTTNRFRIARGAQEIVVRMEARLILDDASKQDDRSVASLLVVSGGDVWRSASAQWNPNVYSNDDFAIGRFKFVTNEWRSFSSHTLTSPAEINDYLNNESKLTPR